MLTLNLLTLQGYFFWKDVAFKHNFCNDSIKTMVSFNLGLRISFFTSPYTTKKIQPCLGLSVCVTIGKTNCLILMVPNPILFDKYICFWGSYVSVWMMKYYELRQKKLLYNKLWQSGGFLKVEVKHLPFTGWYLKAQSVQQRSDRKGEVREYNVTTQVSWQNHSEQAFISLSFLGRFALYLFVAGWVFFFG